MKPKVVMPMRSPYDMLTPANAPAATTMNLRNMGSRASARGVFALQSAASRGQEAIGSATSVKPQSKGSYQVKAPYGTLGIRG
jgi:hypothetical protein